MRFDETFPFDYTYLVSRLDGYLRPRDKITKLLRSGEIIRVRKGLYITERMQEPGLKELLAGMIYGPSYLSLEYALGYYQMIPEQIKMITSVTMQKPKLYYTPAGVYRYRHIKPQLYTLGLDYVPFRQSGFWLATREKALCDLVYYNYRNLKPENVEAYLSDELRIDPADLEALDLQLLDSWQNIYCNPAINSLIRFLNSLQGNKLDNAPSLNKD